MAKKTSTNGNASSEDKAKEPFRHVEITVMESWLKTLNNPDLPADERCRKVSIAVCWMLGKDSQIAKDIMAKGGLL